jgi:uncharacterized protein YeaC (DUF1315 family)
LQEIAPLTPQQNDKALQETMFFTQQKNDKTLQEIPLTW